MDDERGLVLFESKDGLVELPVRLDLKREEVWLNRAQLATLFDRDVKTIGKHVANALREELAGQEDRAVAKFATAQVEGNREVVRQIKHYSLDVVISVGYRVKSARGVEFRRWATDALRRYVVAGHAENERRLEQLGQVARIMARIPERRDACQVLDIVRSYTTALDLLDDYDHLRVGAPEGTPSTYVLNYEECALLFYNALTANTASGSAYGSSLGFTVSNGQVDTSSVMLKSLKGPFVAGDTVQLPFVPKMVYRNDKASESAELNKYDVYYYSESLQTLWVYTRRAAGRITAVSPSASAPTSVTVAGTSYTLGSSAVASQVSSLNGGGVGEVVTLLLGMNNEAAGIVTGEEADSVFYGVVQTATRSLVEENGADVLQKVSVMCTDGIARTVNVDKSLNFPQGWLVEIKVTPEGESVEHIDDRRVNGTINTNATALGAAALADDVEILDTTSEGVAGTVRPSRLSGVTLSDLDVRYYTVNDAGQIDRLILNDVTGDLWSYGVLDDVKNLAMNYSDLKSLVTSIAAGDSTSGTTTTTGTTTGAATGGTDGSGSTSDTTTTVTGATAVDRLSNLLVPTTSEILWGIVSGDILSTAWQKLTSNTGSLMSIGFQQIAEITGTPFKQIFNYIGGGATYICYVNGAVASYTTAIKYPVLAGGIAVRQETTGSVKAMMQLMPLKIDKVGAASVLSGNERYEMADNVQVYLWYKGQYYPTKLAQVDADGYQLTGWYDNFGCAAGKKVRVIIAVKND